MKSRLHKKQQNCNKLLTLFTMGVAMLTGVVAMGLATIRESYHQTKAIEYIDGSHSIIFDSNELNNYIFVNLASYFNDYGSSEVGQIANYNYLNFEFELEEVSTDDGVYWSDDGYQIILFLDNVDFGKFVLYDVNEDVYLDFMGSVLFSFSSIKYSLIKSAVELDIQANNPNPSQPMLDFVSIIVSGIGAFATGVASGVSDFASALFLKVENGAVVGLSVFGGIVAIFAGLALAVAITTKVYLWITSLGN